MKVIKNINNNISLCPVSYTHLDVYKRQKLAADEQGSADAATAIMTTDTHKKEYAIQFELGGKVCTVGAIGKGSGMIAPNMATMLAFYTTDAAVSPILLEKALKTVVPGTYNQMSVDLDTSTNDTLIIMASGLAGNPEICEEMCIRDRHRPAGYRGEPSGGHEEPRRLRDPGRCHPVQGYQCSGDDHSG